MDARIQESKKKHPDTLNNNLALIINQGQWLEAEELATRVRETRIKMLGEQHPHTLNNTADLVLIYYQQGRLGKTEKLTVCVKDTKIRVLTEKHLLTLSSMSHLGPTFELPNWSIKIEEWKKRVLKA